jgi:hypothetical protein
MDLTGWLEFFVEGLATQLTEVKQRGERAIHRDILVQEHKLSERQAIALVRRVSARNTSWQDALTLSGLASETSWVCVAGARSGLW